MNTGRKFAAAFVLVAAFTGASANELVEEIVVVGQRVTTPVEIAQPAAPQVTHASLVPAVELPAIEIGLVDLGADNG